MFDFSPLRKGEKSLAEISASITMTDLHQMTNEIIDTILALISTATDEDVVFVPQDPDAYDNYASDSEAVYQAWTLGHVIVHCTASSEESAARASQLARGVPVETRNRYETPWETVTTIDQVRKRLEESRRMRLAFLDTWPDKPNMELVYIPKNPKYPPFNAMGMFLSGLSHEDSHLGQIADVLEQAQMARTVSV
jgi:hypothetical protein